MSVSPISGRRILIRSIDNPPCSVWDHANTAAASNTSMAIAANKYGR